MKGKISITDNGSVTVSGEVRMTIAEIADLFGVYVSTVNANIRTIIKSGVVRLDTRYGATVTGNTIFPEFYDLEMITALAFRINSLRAKLFRDWLLDRATKTRQPIYLQCDFTSKELILN